MTKTIVEKVKDLLDGITPEECKEQDTSFIILAECEGKGLGGINGQGGTLASMLCDLFTREPDLFELVTEMLKHHKEKPQLSSYEKMLQALSNSNKLLN